MASVTLHGAQVRLSGSLPAPGSKAPDFQLVNGDLENVSLSTWAGKKKLLSIVPSLDTPICAISTKKFNEQTARHGDTAFLIVSTDLPFAMSRFCKAESTANVFPLSMMRSRDFARDYGVLIEDGPLAGVTARAVVVLDASDQVVYTELVSEIGEEPDYDTALAALG